MQWERSESIATAKTTCTHCHGEGVRRTSKEGPARPCNCTLRGVFRACYDRFRHCVTKAKYLSKVTLENCSGKDGHRVWSRKDEDYIADFCLVSKRSLNAEEYRIFRFHFLLGADWRLCCRQLNMDRGTFFHSVYRIQQKLGRVYRELKPYALFPLDEYFGGAVMRPLSEDYSNVIRMPAPGSHQPLRPPLRKSDALPVNIEEKRVA
jgi:hypothetical protein